MLRVQLTLEQTVGVVGLGARSICAVENLPITEVCPLHSICGFPAVDRK